MYFGIVGPCHQSSVQKLSCFSKHSESLIDNSQAKKQCRVFWTKIIGFLVQHCRFVELPLDEPQLGQYQTGADLSGQQTARCFQVPVRFRVQLIFQKQSPELILCKTVFFISADSFPDIENRFVTPSEPCQQPPGFPGENTTFRSPFCLFQALEQHVYSRLVLFPISKNSCQTEVSLDLLRITIQRFTVQGRRFFFFSLKFPHLSQSSQKTVTFHSQSKSAGKVMMGTGIISLFRGQLGCFKPRVGVIGTDVGRTQIMLQSLPALPESFKRCSQAEVALVRIRGDFEKAGKNFDGLFPLLPHQQQVPPPAQDFSVVRPDPGRPGQNSFALLELAFMLEQS